MELDRQIKELIHKTSLIIVEKANTCCYRSDGWEEELVLFTEDEIQSIINKTVK